MDTEAAPGAFSCQGAGLLGTNPSKPPGSNTSNEAERRLRDLFAED
jgi:hypothetical protein